MRTYIDGRIEDAPDLLLRIAREAFLEGFRAGYDAPVGGMPPDDHKAWLASRTRQELRRV